MSCQRATGAQALNCSPRRSSSNMWEKHRLSLNVRLNTGVEFVGVFFFSAAPCFLTCRMFHFEWVRLKSPWALIWWSKDDRVTHRILKERKKGDGNDAMPRPDSIQSVRGNGSTLFSTETLNLKYVTRLNCECVHLPAIEPSPWKKKKPIRIL